MVYCVNCLRRCRTGSNCRSNGSGFAVCTAVRLLTRCCRVFWRRRSPFATDDAWGLRGMGRSGTARPQCVAAEPRRGWGGSRKSAAFPQIERHSRFAEARTSVRALRTTQPLFHFLSPERAAENSPGWSLAEPGVNSPTQTKGARFWATKDDNLRMAFTKLPACESYRPNQSTA